MVDFIPSMGAREGPLSLKKGPHGGIAAGGIEFAGLLAIEPPA